MNTRRNIIFNKIDSYFKHDLKGKVVAVWGLSFKPKTDDIRESSAIFLVKKLLEAGVKVRAYDPAAMDETKKQIPDTMLLR